MHTRTVKRWQHNHDYYTVDEASEANTKRVIALTFIMMVVEIIAGISTGSMALLADGWHMGTHMAALGLTAIAYAYARRHASNPRFTFGTGKICDLGGFASAIALSMVSLLVIMESVERLVNTSSIRFDEAIPVAVIGLAVNLVSAVMLRGRHHHDHGSDQHHHHDDHNLKAAYLHVLADALTSLLAIFALLAGKALGWGWMDPIMGIVGAIVIGRWSYLLLRDTSSVLLDSDVRPDTLAKIRTIVEGDADNRVSDLHAWRVGPSQLGVILSIVTGNPRPPQYYKRLLKQFDQIAHLSIEVNRCPDGQSP